MPKIPNICIPIQEASSPHIHNPSIHFIHSRPCINHSTVSTSHFSLFLSLGFFFSFSFSFSYYIREKQILCRKEQCSQPPSIKNHYWHGFHIHIHIHCHLTFTHTHSLSLLLSRKASKSPHVKLCSTNQRTRTTTLLKLPHNPISPGLKKTRHKRLRAGHSDLQILAFYIWFTRLFLTLSASGEMRSRRGGFQRQPLPWGWIGCSSIIEL